MFADRYEAGVLLAKKLKEMYGDELAGNPQVLVLAIPRGGVVTGDAVAEYLGIKMDVVASRKIGTPYNPELAVGAVTPDGGFFANQEIIEAAGVSTTYINEQISKQKREIERRLIKFRGRADYKLEGRTVVLVDDGIATGATVLAAISWLKRQSLKKLIVAAPVCSRETLLRLKHMADEVLVLHSPVLFQAVGEFYQDFTQVEDDQVVAIMGKYL